MKALIIGAGETGFYIASEFTEENYEVSVIDDNPIQLAHTQKSLNIAGFLGNGTSLSVLEKAGIESTDLLIACTDHDETNLITCLLANQYAVKQKVAVTKTKDFQDKSTIGNYVRSGIDMVINTSTVLSTEIMALANLAAATEVSSFAEKNVFLVGYRVKGDSPLANKALKEIEQPFKEGNFLIACIVRNEESFIPSGEDIINPGDYVYIMTSRRMTKLLNEFLKIKISKSRKAVIAGDPTVGEAIANGLFRGHFFVTMVCSEQHIADQLNKKYSRKKFNAVCGDISEVKLQLKLDVPLSSLFIAVDRDDHANIAAGMVARYLGAQKVIVQVNRSDLLHLPESVGMDVVISPRLITARQIKKMIRGGEDSLDFTTISDTDMEVIEMQAAESSAVIGKTLKELKLPKGVLVGAIVDKQKKVFIASGDSKIEAGDKVVILTMPDKVNAVTEMIEGEIRHSPLNT